MKKYADIKRIITQDFGLTDLGAYRRWISDVRPTIRLTQARLDALSPDAVNCRDFWKVCEHLFGLDPVCNVAVTPEVGALPYDIGTHMDANRMNLRFAKMVGITALLEEFAESRLETLEIGPGFGSLKNFIETHTNHRYTGFDVCPRIPDIQETLSSGLLPTSFVTDRREAFAYVVSTNVFQHLSARQRSRYFQDAHSLLRHGGLFIFNLLVDTGKFPAFMRDEEGNAWCDHYCQYTLIPQPSALYDELTPQYTILYVTQRFDNNFNFVCQKRH
jgi:hypothetical protein